jgi:beta propeller repeat protein
MLALVLITPGGIAAAPSSAQVTVSAPFMLAGGGGNQRQPHMAGDYLVWSNCVTGNCDIWGMDLRNRHPFAISDGPGDEGQPATDGVRVVWRDSRNSASRNPDNLQNNHDIYGAYLDERKGFPLAQGANMQNRPSIWGTTLVYADFRGAASSNDTEAGNVHLSEFPTNRDTVLTSARSAQTRPVTDGKYVVWVDYRNEPNRQGTNADIYAYDLATRTEFSVANAPDAQLDPAISGNIIVWTDFRKGTESDIYGYDLQTRREFPISTAQGSQIEPAISGDLVVWRDFRNEPNRQSGINSDIYGYDLRGKSEFPVHRAPGPQSGPRALGNLVVWEDSSKGVNDTDIQGATVAGVKLVPRQAPPSTYVPGGGGQRFAETGKVVTGIFYDYWRLNGGLPQQGFPISDLMRETSDLDGKPYLVQYFERAVFEYHPEQSDPRFRVLLSQLGTFRYREKYSAGAPAQTPNNTPGSQLFPQTGRRVGGKFLEYWQKNGGLAQQGYPISDEFTEVSDLDGKPYTVQYFERAVFELHTENAGTPYEVLLSQLGTFRYGQKYGR